MKRLSRWQLPIMVGDLSRDSLGAVCARASDLIRTAGRPLAVLVRPTGTAWVDEPDEAEADELIGCFSPEIGTLTRERLIAENLREEVARRRLRTRPTS